jgi:dolichol-phosphate mannosyltransferase
LFLRGLRAYIGFRQTGVDYVRPKRAFGESTNNLLKNLEWAKRGIFSFSNAPLKLLSAGGTVLLGLSIVLGLIVTVLRIWIPNIAPRGATTLLGLVVFGAAIFCDRPVGDTSQNYGRSEGEASSDPSRTNPQW